MHIEMTTGRRIVPASRRDELSRTATKGTGEKMGAVLLLSPEWVAQIELDEQKAIIFAMRSSLSCALTRTQRMCAARPVPELREY